MATKSKNKPGERKVVGLTQLVQFPLLPNEVNEVKTWVITPAEMFDMISDYIQEGIRFEVSQNTKKQGYSILTKFPLEGMRNEGMGFYSNGDTLISAWAVVLVKLGTLGSTSLADFLSERITEETLS